jgi:hypothetical protein
VGLSRPERVRFTIEREKELRLYYDARLGDHLEAGFRVCEEGEWTELHRCLCKREFQLLVLAYPQYEATFAGKPLVEFARRFVCPVVLVGPHSPDEYHLNSPAALVADKLEIPDQRFYPLATATAGAAATPGATSAAPWSRG